MLPLPKWFLRCALLYLLLGAALGATLLVERALELDIFLDLRPGVATVHNHLIAIGTFLFMIMGVSLWMFPRPPGQSVAAVQRDPLGWTSFALMNAGLGLRALVEPFAIARPARALSLLYATSGALLFLGVAFYAGAIWKRIRSPRVEAVPAPPPSPP